MIQIDMPMPKNCTDCCFATADLVNGTIALFCITPVGRKMYAPDLISRKDRPEWCPLKEQQNVIRCKNCKHQNWVNAETGCIVCKIGRGTNAPDWFCADGDE